MEEIWPTIKLLLVRFAYFKKRSRINRYGFPVILILIILLISSILPKSYLSFIHVQTLATLLLILVVTTTSWYGGLGPGLLATILTTSLNFFLLLIKDLPTHPLTGDFVISGIYLVLGILTSIISEARYESVCFKPGENSPLGNSG